MRIEHLRVLREDARFGVAFFRRHPTALALALAGVLLPLAAFGVLADRLRGEGWFPFDAPLLDAARAAASPELDAFFVVVTLLGYQAGVVPVDIGLVAALAWFGRAREGVFAGVSTIGSAVLTLAAKPLFARDRPALWMSIAPEQNYSFPSGHAMGSMTLACVLVLLSWRTRLRWWVLVPALAFVLLVGASRVYLGVHYPSDILAGWTAAMAWVVAVYLIAFARRRPWGETHADPADA